MRNSVLRHRSGGDRMVDFCTSAAGIDVDSRRGIAIRSYRMADVRFSILFGPSSLDPCEMGFPPHEPGPVQTIGVLRRRRPDELTGGWFAWRLMASNNRRLASGVSSFASRLRAVDAITELRDRLADVRAHVATDPNSGTWRWRAELDGVAVAVCPHWYERERDCRGGFAKFVDAVGNAGVAEVGTVLREQRMAASRRRPVEIGGSRPWPTY